MINSLKFLKILQKMGYPNPNIVSIAKASNYDIDNFLSDLNKEFGDRDKVTDFCDKAIEKLSSKKGIRININGPYGDEYVYIHVYPLFYDEEESANDIISKVEWGDSKILTSDPETGEEVYSTIKEIFDNTGMGEWVELDDFLDNIKGDLYNIIFSNCGFGIWIQ